MHHQPGFQRYGQGLGQNPNEIGIAPRDTDLAGANAIAGAQSGKLGEIVVSAQREHLALHADASLCDCFHRHGIAIEADDAQTAKIRPALQRAFAIEIIAMRIKADDGLAETPRQESGLAWAHHAHGNVGIAIEQILGSVR